MTFVKTAPFLAVLAASCAAPANPIVADDRLPPRAPELALARFMREEVNVPFAFMMLETASSQRGRRVHKAAVVLREAAHDLVQWSDLPVMTGEAREVFYTYAANLEYHVGRLEEAAEHSEQELTVHTVEQIRQTCNHCHRFFRPASVTSPDVAYDWYPLESGGLQ